MTSADYLRTIVLPSLSDLLAEPDSQRRAYVACVTSTHLVDHVVIAGHRTHDVRESVCAVGPHLAVCLMIIEGVCTGLKLAAPGPKPYRPVEMAPGQEQTRSTFALDAREARLDEGQWDKPGLTVEHDDKLWFLEDDVPAVVQAYTLAFAVRGPGRDPPGFVIAAELGARRRLSGGWNPLPASLPGSVAPAPSRPVEASTRGRRRDAALIGWPT